MAKLHAGRPPTPITGEFLDSEPSLLQAIIISKKNNGGDPVSWQAVANKLGEEVGQTFSGALMYRIAKGEITSEKVEQALGIKPLTAPAPVCTNPACDNYGRPHVWDCQTQDVIEKPAKPAAKRPARTRIAADVAPSQREALHALAAEYGMTFSQLVKEIADYKAILIWPGDKSLNLFTCRKDDPDQIERQLEKYVPGKFKRIE
jgi:hypothetical protein